MGGLTIMVTKLRVPQGITFSEFWEIKKYKSGFCMTFKEKEWDVWR